jgi:hypothetical protein
VVFDTKRFIGGVLAAGVLAALPAPALGTGLLPALPAPRVAIGSSFGQRCSDDWQLVDYGLIIYLESPSVRAKEQLSQELTLDLRRAVFECVVL